MMGVELLLYGSVWLCLKPFHLIAEDQSCSLHVTFAHGGADVGTSRSASAVTFDEQRRSQE
jgi:hypothetical protein